MRIQQANLIPNLSRADRADGFLSAEFSASQFEEMHCDICMVVADYGSHLGGYMCGCSLAPSAKVPLLARMMALFPVTTYKSKPIDQYQTFVYGPVCVDRPFRGQGVLEGLFREYRAQLDKHLEVGAFFISLDNTRSLRAHIHKLGMRKLCDFSFNGKSYGFLVFDLADYRAEQVR